MFTVIRSVQLGEKVLWVRNGPRLGEGGRGALHGQPDVFLRVFQAELGVAHDLEGVCEGVRGAPCALWGVSVAGRGMPLAGKGVSEA